jgi:hypothetical protein
MELWGPVPLAAATSTGNVTQLYPAWAASSPGVSAGAAIPIAPGGILRMPQGGRVGQIVLETDGTDGGVIQLFDVSGLDALADVSSATVITNTQLTTLIANGLAKQIWEQNFAASPGAALVWAWSHGFLRGLGARMVATGGTCKLNITAEGGFCYRVMGGGYAGG